MALLPRCLFLALLPCIFAQNPPKVNYSYKAMGEMIQPIEETTLQMRFEETFDNATENAAFTVWQFEKNFTYVENGKTKETIEYMDDKECAVVNKMDWINVESPPSLIGYNGTSGKITFSLRQLLNLDPKYLVTTENNKSTTFRNVSARSWVYDLPGTGDDKDAKINVYAYWSDPKWRTTSEKRQVPLGFQITKLLRSGKQVTSSVQFISVFAFLANVVNKKAFEPREGIYCPGRIKGHDLPLFPLVNSLSLRSEFVIQGFMEIKTMDAYYDTENGFLRVDLNRLDARDDEPRDGHKRSRKYSSQVTSKQLGVTFTMTGSSNGLVCDVTPIDKYSFDTQEVINPLLDLNKWGILAIISNGTTDYAYLGMAYKRNMPCHLYQGLRKDWPHEKAGVVSVWEWCFSFLFDLEEDRVKFLDNEIGLVSASIQIINSTDNTHFPAGFRMFHHFYDVVRETSGNMSLATFDISRCFKPEEKYFLEFAVDVTVGTGNIHIFENATSDHGFLLLWKDAITKACKTSPKSLRIANIQSLVIGSRLLIDFYLLGLHQNLTDDAKKGEPSLKDAFTNIEAAINNGLLNITYQPSSKSKDMPLKAKKKSLVKIFADASKFVTYKPLPTETIKTVKPTFPPFSLITEAETTPEKKTASHSTMTVTNPTQTGPTQTGPTQTGPTQTGPTQTGPTQTGPTETGPTQTGPTDETILKPVIRLSGHQSGTVAGVAIAMLLIGITVGACGTFYNFNGLPAFLRFR